MLSRVAQNSNPHTCELRSSGICSKILSQQTSKPCQFSLAGRTTKLTKPIISQILSAGIYLNQLISYNLKNIWLFWAYFSSASLYQAYTIAIKWFLGGTSLHPWSYLSPSKSRKTWGNRAQGKTYLSKWAGHQNSLGVQDSRECCLSWMEVDFAILILKGEVSWKVTYQINKLKAFNLR